jgi:type IV secretory pathway TraG/TraD family ATPase VirD4
VLPGIGDLRTLELVSQLGGEMDVPVRSVSRSLGWGRSAPSVTVSSRRQRCLPVDAVAHLPRGTALVLNGAQPPTWMRLTPWHATSPFARDLPPSPALVVRPSQSQLGRRRGGDGRAL